MLIPGAAAQVAGDGLTDLFFGRVGVFFQEGDQRHQKAGGAVAALDGVGFPEGFLQGMQVVRRAQPFDGHNLVAVGLHGEHQAGTDRLAVEQDGTGPAHAMLAADVGAGQSQIVAQKVAQQQPWLHGPLIFRAVDGDCDRLQIIHHTLPVLVHW